jgi:dCTP deaminase
LKAPLDSQSAAATPVEPLSPGILVDTELRQLLGSAIRCASGAPAPAQVQPASVDLRLGATVHRMRAGFLPGQMPVDQRLAELSASQMDLNGEGAVLERGLVYLIELEEELDLPADIQGRFNPRSSTGRCDLFTRVLISEHPRFDETPVGYRGKLWLEVAPLSFPVRLKRGDRLCQLRLQRGQSSMTRAELIAEHERTPLCYLGERPLGTDEVRFDEDGSIAMRVGLSERSPAGWRAAMNTEVVTFAGDGLHERDDFWDPVHARRGTCVLEPERFYIFASRERISIPPHLAAEMLPIDVGIGELRNNYAGFFDPGFGWDPKKPGGTPAVLEVRAHDVPFLVEDGQVFFRLRFFRTQGQVSDLYGAGRSGPSYRAQDLTLARTFRVGE